MRKFLPSTRPVSEHLFTKTPRASHTSSSIRSMRSENLRHTLAAEIDRAASAAHPDADEVTVELAISADGRPAPTPQAGWRPRSLRGHQDDGQASRSAGADTEHRVDAMNHQHDGPSRRRHAPGPICSRVGSAVHTEKARRIGGSNG